MAASVELLRRGKYRRRYDSNGDGIVDLYYVSGLLLDSEENRSQVANIVEQHLLANGVKDTKWGVPISYIEPERFSKSKALVQVVYGRIRNGGYFLPITYSGVDSKDVLHPIPVCYQEIDNPEWKLKWFDIERKVSVFRWNTRVQEATLQSKRNEFRAFNGMLKDMGTLGMMRLSGGGFRRLASGEVRGELIFEQPQAIKAYAANILGNTVAVPSLLLGQEYKLIEGDPPQVASVAYTDLFTTMPSNAFSWMDFSK